MLSEFGNRIARVASLRLDRHLTTNVAFAQAGPGLADPVIDAAGVTCERILQRRGDMRTVLIVHHPVWGRCVLKTTCGVGAAGIGLRNLRLAEMVEAWNVPVFPRVYEATADYTLEEFISGKTLRQWIAEDFRMEPLETFFLELRDWSGRGGPWLARPSLQPHEIKAIIRTYIRKCIGQNAYFDTRYRLSGLFALFRQRRELKRDLVWLVREAERIEIPRGLMCGDMSNVNLLVDEARDRVFMIDYEFMGPGHIGFDCAYLLASLDKLPIRSDAMQAMRAFLHSEDFAGTPERARFFAAYCRLLTQITRTIYGRPQ